MTRLWPRIWGILTPQNGRISAGIYPFFKIRHGAFEIHSDVSSACLKSKNGIIAAEIRPNNRLFWALFGHFGGSGPLRPGCTHIPEPTQDEPGHPLPR